MRKRFHKEEEHENTDRWLISYADFLTLIFTFFAALYALSTIDKEKVGVFSTSLRLAFHVIEKPVQGTEDSQKLVTSELAGKISNVEGLNLKTDPRGVVITMANDTAFVSGSADIKDSMTSALEGLADVLKKTPGRIVIEGHTDNVALTSAKYKSNWELATARAASVLHVFIKHGIDPNRLIIAGYGEFRPLDSNETEEGRARNRRVEIVFAPASIK
jgi:chemotaxis protein MotB